MGRLLCVIKLMLIETKSLHKKYIQRPIGSCTNTQNFDPRTHLQKLEGISLLFFFDVFCIINLFRVNLTMFTWYSCLNIKGSLISIIHHIFDFHLNYQQEGPFYTFYHFFKQLVFLFSILSWVNSIVSFCTNSVL